MRDGRIGGIWLVRGFEGGKWVEKRSWVICTAWTSRSVVKVENLPQEFEALS